jgi:hypothetical protein
MYYDLSKESKQIDQRIQQLHRNLQQLSPSTQLDAISKELIVLHQLNALIILTLSQKDFDETL